MTMLVGFIAMKSGKTIRGTFTDDEADGFCVETYEEGLKYEGMYKAGKKHGKGAYTDDHGVTYKQVYKNGALEKHTLSIDRDAIGP